MLQIPQSAIDCGWTYAQVASFCHVPKWLAEAYPMRLFSQERQIVARSENEGEIATLTQQS